MIKKIKKLNDYEDFADFKEWCYNTGNNPSHYESIKEFVDGVKNDDLIECDCCGEYFGEEHSCEARYDEAKTICPDCRCDGN